MDRTIVQTIICGILLSYILLAEPKYNTARRDPSSKIRKFRNIEVTENASWLQNVTFGIVAVDRYTSLASLRVRAVKPLRTIDLEIEMFKRLSGWKPWVFSGNASLCAYLSNRKFNPILNIFKSILEKYTNLNQSCPLSGDIILKDINLEDLRLGVSVLPDGYYKTDFRVTEGKKREWIMDTHFYFDVKN